MKTRTIGRYPAIGIRPVIDGRRGALKVRKKLEALGVENLRLVINRFDRRMFKKLGFYADLDAVIDAAQTQLIALVPFSIEISVIMQRGAAGLEQSSALQVFDRLADRLDGQRVPLLYR